MRHTALNVDIFADNDKVLKQTRGISSFRIASTGNISRLYKYFRILRINRSRFLQILRIFWTFAFIQKCRISSEHWHPCIISEVIDIFIQMEWDTEITWKFSQQLIARDRSMRNQISDHYMALPAFAFVTFYIEFESCKFCTCCQLSFSVSYFRWRVETETAAQFNAF